MADDKLIAYDSADYLETEDDIVAYIEAVMADGGDDPAYLMRALGVIARALGLRIGFEAAGPVA
jgi:probable addiction module antidote protein